jgi:hypothetical protein
MDNGGPSLHSHFLDDRNVYSDRCCKSSEIIQSKLGSKWPSIAVKLHSYKAEAILVQCAARVASCFPIISRHL